MSIDRDGRDARGFARVAGSNEEASTVRSAS